MDTTGRPVIALTPTVALRDDILCTPIIRMSQYYVDGVVAAGGMPVVLPVTGDIRTYEGLFGMVDAFLLTGGSDIDPVEYGGESSLAEAVTPARDYAERLMLSYAWKADLPVLGVCRGFQMLDVFFGGTLYEDLPRQFGSLDEKDPIQRRAKAAGELDDKIFHRQPGDYFFPGHDVLIEPGSLMEKVFGRDRMGVNSIHHQGVRDVGRGLVATAHATDGLVEGLEAPGRRFMLGVQWHPEYFCGSGPMGCAFEALVEAARLRRSERGANDQRVPVFLPERGFAAAEARKEGAPKRMVPLRLE